MSAVPKNSTAGKFAFFIIWASPKWSNQVRLFQFKVAIRHTLRGNVNKPSNANDYHALCHNTAFIFVTYDPQIMHGKQTGNRKQTFLEKQGTLSETKLIFVAFNQGARISTKWASPAQVIRPLALQPDVTPFPWPHQFFKAPEHTHKISVPPPNIFIPPSLY